MRGAPRALIKHLQLLVHVLECLFGRSQLSDAGIIILTLVFPWTLNS